jgi:DNA mismatch repair protein MutS2
MNPRTLEQLEFPKLLELIAGFAGSAAARDEVAALQPLADRPLIEGRLAELTELLGFFDRGGHMSVGGLRDIRDLLAALVPSGASLGAALSGSDLLRVRADIDVFLALQKSFAEAVHAPLLSARISRCPDFTHERNSITRSINEQGEVRDDATPRLTGIRREMSKLRQEIEKRLGELLHSGNEVFQDRFFTLRNDRYCVPVKASSQSLVQGIIHDQSGSGQTVFVEPLEFLGSNNRIARLKSEEREEILRILRELTERLATRRDELDEMFATLVFFDVLNAKMRFCRKYRATRPEIVPDGRLELIDARHPLLHPDCVPLTVSLTREQGALIITGPNGGGKTVALKTVGNSCLLLQTGCYILADEQSKLPIFTEILTDIGESQSIENHLSTFTAHITSLTHIFNHAGNRALVLIDEIGVGTDPVEGSALAIAVLKAFLRKGALSVVTSHYDSLKQAAFQTPGFVNAAMEFDYDAFRPTFRFIQGIAGRSNALLVSKTFGLPEEILQEMSRLLEGHGGDEGRLLEALERERARAEKLRVSWEQKNRELSWKLQEQREIMARLDTFRRTRRDELIETFEGTLKDRIKEIEKLIHGFREKLTTGSSSEDLAAVRSVHQQARQAVADVAARAAAIGSEPDAAAATTPAKLEVGDLVHWLGGNSRGVIESIDDERVRAQVDFDGKVLNIALTELRLAESSERRRSGPTGRVTASAPLVRSEIDLRGMRVEEALEKAEVFLKLAAANRIGRAFLIHGKGTGALQRAVHEYLKRSPYRNKFRFGRYGEGDMGVTVVVFDPAADVETTQLPDQKPIPAKKRKFRQK